MTRFLMLLFLAALAGCSPDSSTLPGKGGDASKEKSATDSVAKSDSGKEKPAPDVLAALAEGKKCLLPSEPGVPRSIIDIRKNAKDGDEVVLAGQVGGLAKPFTDGRALFVAVDLSLKPALECKVPWDFCETDEDELKAGRLVVKFVDAKGKTLKAGAREMFGLKELSQFVVKGKVSRDSGENVVILASGIHVRPEAKK